MKKIRTHYQNLQVTENASIEVIRGAYKYLAQKWHPDKHQGDRAKAEDIMKILNTAYEVLSDPELRKDHDQWIALQRNKMSQGQNEQTHRGDENRQRKNAHQDAEASRQNQARQEAIKENQRRDVEARRQDQARQEATRENQRRDAEARRQNQARQEAIKENQRRDAEARRQKKVRVEG